MKQSTDASPIAFRIGQIDALAKTLLASPALYSPEMRASLALRWLSRAWQQYRQDRAITLGPALIGAECATERNAFLTLFEQALPRREKLLSQAVRTVRKIAIRPMASEVTEAETIVAAVGRQSRAQLRALNSNRRAILGCIQSARHSACCSRY